MDARVRSYFVKAEWKAGAWHTTKSNVHGLETEADTIDDLLRKLEDQIPDLLELNGAAFEVGDHEVWRRIVPPIWVNFVFWDKRQGSRNPYK